MKSERYRWERERERGSDFMCELFVTHTAINTFTNLSKYKLNGKC